jgi:hypothetical protein
MLCSPLPWQFFGHALTLLSGTPWDLMEKWIRMFKGKPVRIQVVRAWVTRAVHTKCGLACGFFARLDTVRVSVQSEHWYLELLVVCSTAQ